MMSQIKFGDVPPGTRFKYNGSVYHKVRMNFARNAEQARIIFPSDTQVETLEDNGRGLNDKPPPPTPSKTPP